MTGLRRVDDPVERLHDRVGEHPGRSDRQHEVEEPVELAAPFPPEVEKHAEVRQRVDEDHRQDEQKAAHQEPGHVRPDRERDGEAEPERHQELDEDRDVRGLPRRVHAGDDLRQSSLTAHAVPHSRRHVLAGDRRRDRGAQHRGERHRPSAAPEPLTQHERGKRPRAGQALHVVDAPADDLAPVRDDQQRADDHDRVEDRPRRVPARILGLLG